MERRNLGKQQKRKLNQYQLTHIMVVLLLPVLEERLKCLVGAENLLAIGVDDIGAGCGILDNDTSHSTQRTLL